MEEAVFGTGLIQKNKVPLDTFQGKATYRFKSIKE
jgi:hypothetical protein